MCQISLQLYINNNAKCSDSAVSVLRQLLESQKGCHLDIIDVREKPEMAERAHVMATPTLIIENGYLRQRIVGDLGKAEALIRSLGIGCMKQSASKRMD